MRFAVDPWDPSYGASLDTELGASTVDVDPGVETPPARWAPIGPAHGLGPAATVLFVDGVRRIDAQVWVAESDGSASPALCASYAAGVLCCCPDLGAHLLLADVRRGLVTTAGGATDVVTAAGTYRVVAAAARADVAPMQLLSLALQRDLSDVELAAAAAARGRHAPPDTLLVVDGPLRGRESLPRTVGFVKSHRSEYLPPALNSVVAQLAAGQRTPVFRLIGGWPRHSWYLRLPGAHGAPWAGVVRVECDGLLNAAGAAALAGLSQATLVRFASAAHKDARAPQNLYPIAGLERGLRRRLGDPGVLYRALRRAAAA